MTNHRLSGLAAVVCGCLVAACGGASAPGTSQPVPTGRASVAGASGTGSTAATSVGAFDDCTLLTSAEVEAAVSAKVASSGPDPRGISHCRWVIDGFSNDHVSIGVTLYLHDSRTAKDFAFDTRDSKPIAGLGDAAGYDIRSGGEMVVTVLHGDSYFRLQSTYRPHDSADSAPFVALARQILPRIP